MRFAICMGGVILYVVAGIRFDQLPVVIGLIAGLCVAYGVSEP